MNTRLDPLVKEICQTLAPFFFFSALLTASHNIFCPETYAASTQSKKNTMEDGKFHEAINCFKEKSFEKSRRILKALVSKNPRNALYWFNLGNSNFQLGNFNEAQNNYERVIVLKSPLTPFAKFYLAKTLVKMNRLQEARDILEDLIDSKQSEKKQAPHLYSQVENFLDDLDLSPKESSKRNFLVEGINLYHEGKYPEAQAKFDQSLSKEGEDSRTYMMKGLSYLKTNNPRKAKEEFNEVLATAPSGDLRDRAQDLLEQIREGLWQKEAPYFAYLESDVGYNNNIVNTGKSEPSLSDSVYHLFFSSGYTFAQKENLSARINYKLFWEYFPTYPSETLLNHTLQVLFTYQENDWLLQGAPRYSLQYLGGNPFLTSPAMYLRAQKRWNDFETGTSFDFAINKSSDSPNFDYLNGKSETMKVYLGYSGVRVYTNAFYFYEIEDSGDLVLTRGLVPLAYDGYGPGIIFMWSPADLWEFTFNGTSKTKNFKNPIRKDTELLLYGKLAYLLKPSLSAFLSLENISNNSTMGPTSAEDKNFNKSIVLLGLAWDILP